MAQLAMMVLLAVFVVSTQVMAVTSGGSDVAE